MKYYNRPSWICSKPVIMKCFDENSIPFGRNVFNTIVDLIAQRFDYGTWWQNGKEGVPYGMDIMKRQLYFEIGIDPNNKQDTDQVMQIINKLQDNKVMSFEEKELSIAIEYPDLMLYVDKTQEDKARELFGKGKITKQQIEVIRETKELPEELRSHLEVEEKKLINREEKIKCYKPKKTHNNFAKPKDEYLKTSDYKNNTAKDEEEEEGFY